MPVVLTAQRRRSFAVATLGAVAFVPCAAHATTWLVSCTNGTVSNGSSVVNDQATPLGSLLGMPGIPATLFPPGPLPGDTIKIGGTCTEDVTITTRQLTLVNHQDTESPNGDGVEGQLEIDGVTGIQLLGLTLGSTSATVTFSSASDQAQLYVHDGAEVTVQFSVVENSSLFGVLAARSSTVSVQNTTVTTNGSSTAPAGIRASDGSTIILSAPNPNATVSEVSSSHGDGISMMSGSSLVVQDFSQIFNNSGRQISLLSGSAAHITGTRVDGNACTDPSCSDGDCDSGYGCINASACLSNCGASIDIEGGSSVRLDGTEEVVALPGENGVLAGEGSGLVTSGSLIAATAVSSAVPVLQASYNSVIGLAGGNLICSNSCDSSTIGTAIQIDHVSTLTQLSPAMFGYPSAADQIFGNGSVQLQSTIDIGLGPSVALTWTPETGTAATDEINVSQNSSFRLDGGVTINGKVSLGQGSNGFVNASNTGTNSVTEGIICPFTAIPASHLAFSSGTLSPTPSLSDNYLSTEANTCLSF
jgi:hypothetical protein